MIVPLYVAYAVRANACQCLCDPKWLEGAKHNMRASRGGGMSDRVRTLAWAFLPALGCYGSGGSRGVCAGNIRPSGPRGGGLSARGSSHLLTCGYGRISFGRRARIRVSASAQVPVFVDKNRFRRRTARNRSRMTWWRSACVLRGYTLLTRPSYHNAVPLPRCAKAQTGIEHGL